MGGADRIPAAHQRYSSHGNTAGGEPQASPRHVRGALLGASRPSLYRWGGRQFSTGRSRYAAQSRRARFQGSWRDFPPGSASARPNEYDPSLLRLTLPNFTTQRRGQRTGGGAICGSLPCSVSCCSWLGPRPSRPPSRTPARHTGCVSPTCQSRAGSLREYLLARPAASTRVLTCHPAAPQRSSLSLIAWDHRSPSPPANACHRSRQGS